MLAAAAAAAGCAAPPSASTAQITASPPPEPTTIAVCFAPEEDCAAFIAGAINAARRHILVGAYNFTRTAVLDALLRAAARGVRIEALVDRTTPCERGSAVPALMAAGIPVWIDRAARIAHQKVLIIDGERVVAGSYNFSLAAQRNSENANLIRSPALAAAYAGHWQRRRAGAEPYAGGDCPSRS